jgi:hypothetical protein
VVAAWVFWVVEERRPDGTMMGCRMMLGKIVGMIGAAWFPMDLELFLAYAVAYPVKAHVHGLGAALLDGIVADTGSSAVIGHDGGFGLGVAHFGKARADGACLAAVSASAALETTTLRMWLMTVTGPLVGRSGALSPLLEAGAGFGPR